MPSHPEIATTAWRKSSYSNSDGGDCLEVADGFTDILPVRDSKTPTEPVLVFPAAGWAVFISSVKTGGFSA